MAPPDVSTHTVMLDAAINSVNRELRALLKIVESTPANTASIAHSVAAVENAGRLMDAARVRVVAPLVTRPDLVDALGHTSASSAVATLATIREASARERIKVATAVSDDLSITGVPLAATLPLVGAALDTGTLGLDAATAIVTELTSVAGRVDRAVIEAAESVMVDRASRGEQSPLSNAVSVDYLKSELHLITSSIDPDGARPREQRAMRRRSLRVGAQDEDGLMPFSGRALPEIGILLLNLIEAERRSPRFSIVGEHSYDTGGEPSDDEYVNPDFVDESRGDTRTPDQRRHDAFAEILYRASNAESAPSLDGAPVAVLVTVAAADLHQSDGRPGDPIGLMADSRFPVSRRTVERLIDDSGYRTVTLTPNGAVHGISSRQRCFTAPQRYAIAARDGARCAAIGCTNSHRTLQAHHVRPHRDGGPTETSNGILLCFWHHQQVDTGPWEYRMHDGVPQVRGPGILEWTSRRPPIRATG